MAAASSDDGDGERTRATWSPCMDIPFPAAARSDNATMIQVGDEAVKVEVVRSCDLVAHLLAPSCSDRTDGTVATPWEELGGGVGAAAWTTGSQGHGSSRRLQGWRLAGELTGWAIYGIG
ncbi:hypothetical protein ZWY2020_052055 [Hordeum vulgare]|nr:hypothetical protein ZWY2020_052055 [Hordeum vulgare]